HGDVAKVPGADRPVNPAEQWLGALLEQHTQAHTSRIARSDHCVSVRKTERQWLLDEHVLARFRRRDRLLGMLTAWRREAHDVNVGALQKLRLAETRHSEPLANGGEP